MLCNLAVEAMEALQQEHPGRFTWSVVDISTRDGVNQLRELRPRCGRMVPVPGVVVGDQIIFDHIPEMEEFAAWLIQETVADGGQ